jgi:chitin disaccharide deacetylase
MQVILNADDFGRSTEINRAVLQAHREGVLTSASLMVTGDAAEEAVALARAAPALAVGLHLVLSDGRPASPAQKIPHLTGRSGRFPANPARVWIEYGFSAAARAEMALEVRAQFQRFAATGLPLDHVDAHQHIHMHPAVFHALLPLAMEYDAGGIRLPRDDFRLAIRYDGRGAATKAVWAAVFGILCRRHAGVLASAARGSDQAAAARRLAITDRVYGLMQSGHMDEAYVLQVLAQAPGTSAIASGLAHSPTSGQASSEAISCSARGELRPSEKCLPGHAAPSPPREGGEQIGDSSCPAANHQRSTHAAVGATAPENVILSDPIPDLRQFGQDSEESREAGRGDSSLEARRYGSWLTNPLSVTAGVMFRTRIPYSEWPSVELYFHPSLASEAEPLGPNPGDLAALLSPAVREAIRARGWVRATYASLKEVS